MEKMLVTTDLVMEADRLHPKMREELESKAPFFMCLLQQVPAGRHLQQSAKLFEKNARDQTNAMPKTWKLFKSLQ
jgi:hypothetical protein